MKTIFSALAVLLVSTAALYAAEPAKVMDSKGGKIYTDAKGMTLYTFDKDAKDKSNCDAACMKNWPPFKAASSAKAEGEWTLVKSADGSHMWAYEGKPLYTYAGDKKAGDMAGDGKGGMWHAAKAM